jgi:hypothetical protein
MGSSEQNQWKNFDLLLGYAVAVQQLLHASSCMYC